MQTGGYSPNRLPDSRNHENIGNQSGPRDSGLMASKLEVGQDEIACSGAQRFALPRSHEVDGGKVSQEVDDDETLLPESQENKQGADVEDEVVDDIVTDPTWQEDTQSVDISTHSLLFFCFSVFHVVVSRVVVSRVVVSAVVVSAVIVVIGVVFRVVISRVVVISLVVVSGVVVIGGWSSGSSTLGSST
ncbi:unnamed protein product [Ranitomeya imitator]|uniref:Uncharacterized protein n=1 Tax=Ranitomeya imitator TaxID=111125 RepID=A0ABN9KXG2_9NEOB|nr:unnamed protein product [Ranitomeya imitator]